MIQNIIFDWTGVVKDSIKAHLLIVNGMFSEFGVAPISLQELQDYWKQPYMTFYNKYLPDLTVEQEEVLYVKYIREVEKDGVAMYPEINELIKKFKSQGKKMVVVSSDSPETIVPEVRLFGLEGVFEEVVAGSTDKEGGAKRLIEKYAFKPEETLFIGDSNQEIEAGKNLGIKTCAVSWGFGSEKNLLADNPDFFVRNLKELEDIINEV